MQLKIIPDVESIDMQTEIQWYMRPFIVDFLIEAHQAFGLLPETLFLTINILDRYCSKRIVYRRHFQLVGCTALWIACKFSETPRAVPHLKELEGMCCGLYDQDMFVQMERHVMDTLNWYIGAATVDGFLKLAIDGQPEDVELENMAFYIAEMATFYRDFVSVRPSDIAKAALYLAAIILHRRPLPASHWAATHNNAVLVQLSQLLARPTQVLYTKYKAEHKNRVSGTVQQFLDQHAAVAQAAQNAPPTPPSSSPQVANDAYPGPFATPQKSGLAGGSAPIGTLTPPITPDSENFHGFKNGQGPYYPETPMPHGPSGLQHQQAPPPVWPMTMG